MSDAPTQEQVANLARLDRSIRKGIRFAVVAEEKHSGVWKAWTNRSDFYFGAKNALGAIKVSLHQSGKCRVAFLESQISRMQELGIPTPADRAIAKWERPEIPAIGACHAASIIFPAAYLSMTSKLGTAAKPVIAFHLSPDDEAAEIGFFYSTEHPDAIESRFSKIGMPLFFMALDDGKFVTMLARPTSFSPSVLPSPDVLTRTPMKPTTGEAPKQGDDLAAVFWNAPKQNEALMMIEVGGIQLSSDGKLILPGQPT